MASFDEVKGSARLLAKGNKYEDFEIGQMFEHHWGRTITAADNTLFTTMTLHYNPLYFNEQYAHEKGHPAVVVNPLLVFLVTFGLSVEDLSEAGGAFLGVEALTFHQSVYPGDTLIARSTVTSKRESASHPEAGIVSWHTEGFNQREERVIDFQRTNMIEKRGG